jgi:hypothetical protein
LAIWAVLLSPILMAQQCSGGGGGGGGNVGGNAGLCTPQEVNYIYITSPFVQLYNSVAPFTCAVYEPDIWSVEATFNSNFSGPPMGSFNTVYVQVQDALLDGQNTSCYGQKEYVNNKTLVAILRCRFIQGMASGGSGRGKAAFKNTSVLLFDWEIDIF